MANQYKAVFFDLDGTLRIPTPDPTAAFVHYARSLDIHIPFHTEIRVKRWAHQYWGQDEMVKQEMERLGMDDFWINYSRLLLEAVDVEHDIMNRAKMVRQWFDSGYNPNVERAASSFQLISRLKEEGYVTGLISNRNASLETAVSELGLEGLFDFTLAAGEIGIWKPNPAIFWHALSSYPDLQPAQCLYIGDNYFADVRGAKAAGLTPILFDPGNIYQDVSCLRITKFNELSTII